MGATRRFRAGRLPRSLRRGADDIRHGRRLETYGIFGLGTTLTALGLFDVVGTRVVQSAVLATVAFLVLHAEPAPARLPVDEVLQDRTSFTQFGVLLRNARDIRVYGPTAVNVVVNTAEIRREVLQRGGTFRIVVQSPEPGQLARTAAQLDTSLDLGETLRSTLGGLRRLAGTPGFDYRLLGFNPGFSLIVVDAHSPDGYLIVETHGFRDESISERMHITIRRRDSPRWFDYWSARFDAIWETAVPEALTAAAPAPSSATGERPAGGPPSS